MTSSLGRLTFASTMSHPWQLGETSSTISYRTQTQMAQLWVRLEKQQLAGGNGQARDPIVRLPFPMMHAALPSRMPRLPTRRHAFEQTQTKLLLRDCTASVKCRLRLLLKQQIPVVVERHAGTRQQPAMEQEVVVSGSEASSTTLANTVSQVLEVSLALNGSAG